MDFSFEEKIIIDYRKFLLGVWVSVWILGGVSELLSSVVRWHQTAIWSTTTSLVKLRLWLSQPGLKWFEYSN